MPRPRTILTDEARKQANREKAARYYSNHKDLVLGKLKIKTNPAVQRNKEHLILKNKIRHLCSIAVKLDYDRLKSILNQIEPFMTSSDDESE